MNRYVLLQRPIIPSEDSAPIEIIDNSKEYGKRRIEKLLEYGYTHVGFIESERTEMFLKQGFNYKFYAEEDKREELIDKLRGLVDEYKD